ncbi:hypothetical protein [Paenibacillus flagellatus]|uniref:Uncharacterized protein n=1 Tax=Paenibacillus flagellatus TaxID=2211139 RepID=A0A2V5KWD2_9BACL|nr:hypothetical protein [Paenibacillus flagellatus]PYI56617.1 hypothetical protein DLM86_06520 [Paenibacillus flagellatus]
MPHSQLMFGYYHGDGFPAGAPDSIDRIAALGNSNVIMINSAHPPDALRHMLDRVAACGCPFIISVSDCFFRGGRVGAIGSAHPREDSAERWAALQETLRPYERHLLGYYFDEPYWNGVSERDFRDATRMIRRRHPDKKVMVCATALELAPDAFDCPIPEAGSGYYEFVTDGAFDIYRAWDPFLYGYLDEKLRRLLPSEAAIWYVVWGFAKGTPDGGPAALIVNLLNHYRLALRDRRCAGLLVFSFASGDAGDWGSGMDRLLDPPHPSYDPLLHNLQVNVGRALIGRAGDDLFVHSADGGGEGPGSRGWRYAGLDAGGSPRPLVFVPERAVWADPEGAGGLVCRDLIAPGAGGEQTLVQWAAPKPGRVYVAERGGIQLAGMSPPARLRVQIRHNDRRIWPEADEWREIGPGAEQSGYRLKLEVVAGDCLSFVVSAGEDRTGGQDSGLLRWDPVVSYINDHS